MSPRQSVIPVFVPHLGCPHRCVFCNQNRISGAQVPATAQSVRSAIEKAAALTPLETKRQLAFYGGSFTAIPAARQEALLSAAAPYLARGVIVSIRLSTRPDAIDDETLARLARYGVETVELGAQSMTWERRFRKGNEARAGLIEILSRMLAVSDPALKLDTKPSVVLMVGVNGVGKTTTIGKLAARLKADGKDVLLCAGDTFRAAAAEQLTIWAERAGVDIVKHGEGSDPAAVVFDGINAAKARGKDVIVVDTAGRLHNKQNLMRFRHTYAGGDIQRIGVQHDLLMALAKQTLTAGNIKNIDKLIDVYEQYVDTNLTSNNLAFYLEQFLKLKPENITFSTIPNNAMAATAGVLIASNLRFARLLRRTRRALDTDCPLPVYVCGGIPSPCLLFGKVYITQATAADETRLRYALAHEITHHRHGLSLLRV